MTISATYRVMQYNIMHNHVGYASQAYLEFGLENRKSSVADTVKKNAPDVLFLAERFEEWAGVGEGSVDLMQALGHGYALVENTIAFTTAAGGTAQAINRTPIVYNTNTFRPVSSGYQLLTEEATTERSQNKRAVTWAILEDVTDRASRGERVAVFGTHWSVNRKFWGDNSSLAPIKALQSQEIQDLINGERFCGLPIVFGGDLNVTYAELYSIYQTLLDGCRLTDAARAVSDTPVNVVDHIAVSNRLEVLDFFFAGENRASDHFAICCDVNLKNAAEI